ncbi:Spc98 family-domain-containing protein [Hypoxylon sp. FL1150]|nr:Spc98 family-domain-containing protein [Hypoxylon sp. FL1150]
MADEDPADVFAFPDFNQSSRWLNLSSTNQFFTVNFQDSSQPNEGHIGVKPTNADADGFFKLPHSLLPVDVNEANDTNHQDGSIDKPLHNVDLQDLDVFDDSWLQTNEPKTTGAEFKTWDAFLLPDIPQLPPLFITEAGPGAYDAALKSTEIPLGIGDTKSNVIQTSPYLAALLALAFGRGSVFFVWDEEKASFTPSLDGMRISGYSSEVLESFQKRCLDCGYSTRFLSAFVRTTYRKHSGAVKVALAKAVDIILFSIQELLGSRSKEVRSLLQLQSFIQPVQSLLAYSTSLIVKVLEAKTDERTLSLIFRETQALEHSNVLLSEVMREILSRVSEPWAHFAEKWIGIQPEEGIPLTKKEPGNGFVKVENLAIINDAGFETEEPGFVLDEERMPEFVPSEVASTMFETGKTLRLLRTHHPDHPLCRMGLIDSSKPPALQWHFNWKSIGEFQEDVKSYERRLFESVQQEHTKVYITYPAMGALDEDYDLQFYGQEEAQLERRLLASIVALNQPPTITSKNDTLSKLLRARLFDDSTVENSISDFSPHWSLIPYHSFGPLVAAQARVINREYMKLLFTAHGLKVHLSLQKQFHLLGNGVFCSRLSHALFDPNLDTAERQAGVALSGGVMGLRLSGRDTWPPASSELRLALMGVLTESYLPSLSEGARQPEGKYNLPGDVSFAVRDLSPEEIDKCLDPGSLEALDFLRLLYKPPSPLLPVFSPVILLKYDRIFRLLLRVLRMLYVTEQLFQDTISRTSRWHDVDTASIRFRFEAQHFVSSISAYFFETGIEMPWQRFDKWLGDVQADLTKSKYEPDKARILSPEELREEHERMLDRIMYSLLLRKRQQPIMKLLEDIFTAILKFSKVARSESAGKGAAGKTPSYKNLYDSFRKKVDGGQTVKPVRFDLTNDEKRGEGTKEENTIDRLLIKLEMNLTLTEELERLEQSITLTLQEIDHNFSKAHRIVTTSILPLVEQYGEQSKAVWEASKFWKQFFEASANVSLSGYEELAGDQDTTAAEETTTLDETISDFNTTTSSDADVTAEPSEHRQYPDDSLLDDAEMSGSTPRPPATKSLQITKQPPQFAAYDSPYEKLRRELKGGNDNKTQSIFKDDDLEHFADNNNDDDTLDLPAARRFAEAERRVSTHRLPDMSMTPRHRDDDDVSSSLLEAPAGPESSPRRNKDPLLHRVLDKNYRLQATPHKGATGVSRFAAARGRSPDREREREKHREGEGEEDRTRRALWADSPMSSPEMAVPKLRSDLYMSPVKLGGRGRLGGNGGGAPRTPGVSVQTPATAKKTRDVFAGAKGKGKRDPDEITWESDDDDDDDEFAGMSPPKTIQFALPPSKLMQTPAREASKRIVDDILITAGAMPDESSEYSPTMVKMNQDILDDTF